MGILSDMRRKLKAKKQQKINEEEIEKVLKELKEIDSNPIMDEETKNLRRQYAITKFALLVNNGDVKFEVENCKDPLEIVERILEKQYHSIGEVGKEIRFSHMFQGLEDEIYECVFYPGVHRDKYEKMEKLALDFYKRYPDDKNRNFDMNPLSILEIHNIMSSYFEKGISNDEFLEQALGRLKIFTTNKVIERIKSVQDKKEQERMYDEYVHDFLNGVEETDEYFVKYFKESDFMRERAKRKICQQYEVQYDKEPLVIYDAKEDELKKLDRVNRKRAEERLNKETTASDLVLVRTTNVFPKHGVVEILDKHSMPELEDSLFRREINESGLEQKDFGLYSFINRRTSHWTLNGLVASHMYGNFEGRNFIIVEPFEKQVNNDGLLSIDESDTYFNGDLKLSDKAIILMKLEEYKERYKDPTKRKEMENMNVRLFVGDERIAVKMLLQELGYVYEDIGTWGYDLSTNTPELEYARKLEEAMRVETTRLQEEGKNVETVTHFYSDSRTIDNNRMWKLEEEKIDKFVNMLAENSDVNFSPKYLKRVFFNRMFYKDDNVDHYLDRNIEEPEGLLNMGPKEVFDKIGPDKIKEITKKYNEMVLEEHRAARKQKDEELLKKGWLTKDEREGDEIVD